MSTEPILSITDLQTGYGEVQVLWGISLAVRPGQVTTIIGANGAGKTTTLYATMGSVQPWSGSIRLKGEDVTTLPAHAKARRGLVLVPEGRQLFNNMTVDENLEMGAFSPRVRGNIEHNRERVFDLFPRLRERRGQKAGTFSGGEQQMLAVGRGLMAEPEVLMIDELSLGLSPLMAQQLFQILKQLKRQGTTILLVEQNVHLALALSDYAYVLAEGRIFLEGPAKEVANNAQVKEAYLGH
ncbi:MAG: ABC transporter ATP-binding protein [Rhodospirillaceae bacterium]